MECQDGDLIYLFTDGFADQFGGPDGKKYKYRRFRHLLLNLHQLPMEKNFPAVSPAMLEIYQKIHALARRENSVLLVGTAWLLPSRAP